LENNAKLDFKKWKQFAIEYRLDKKLKSYTVLYINCFINNIYCYIIFTIKQNLYKVYRNI